LAGKLLVNAPLDKFPFPESQRINAAVDVLPPGAALVELQRAEQAGLKIDGWTAARAYRQVGQNAQAAAALRRGPPPNDFEAPERRQLQALFVRIGLRHMWLALAVFVMASFLVGVLRQGKLLATLNGSTVIAAADQQHFAMTTLWTIGLGMMCLAYTASRLSWPEWRGTGGWRAI
jgi:hypothetical protein